MKVVEIYYKDNSLIFKTEDGKWYDTLLEWPPMELSDKEVKTLTTNPTNEQ